MPDNWFKEWFNTQDYLEIYKHRDKNDARKIVSLISRTVTLKKGAKVLDLACGNGRHSVLFASKGFDVLGIDLSPYLIKQAKQKLSTDYFKYRNRLKFEIRDMRNIRHKNEFDLVVNLFSSFGYFDTDRENIKVITSIARCLKKNGFFFFDFLNARQLEKTLVPLDITGRNQNMVVQVRGITGGFVKKDILIFKNKRSSGHPVLNHFYEKIKLYSQDDFKKIFKKNGLKIIRTFGDYRGSRFKPDESERQIILAQKR